MNSTSGNSIDFLDVAAATATVAGCLATLAALFGVIMHRNASFCAALINFVCCCRKRTNRVASSLHVRRAGGVLAELGGVVVHPPAAPVENSADHQRGETPALDPLGFAGGAGTTSVENIYIEPLELTGMFGEPRPASSEGHPRPGGPPPATPSRLVAPVPTPQVFNLISAAEHIALEMAAPPLAGRAKKQSEFVRKGARNESFKL
jgi:hypothetical protein